MRPNPEQLTRQLESVLGADAVTDDPSRLAFHKVDGRTPAIFCAPDTVEQVSAALRICCEAEAAVTAWGGGTAMQIGNPPHNVDLVLSLSRLNRFIEHDGANLTLTVQAGVRLLNLQRLAADQKQFLPFDAPYPSTATVGGTIAANLNGPRRSFYGAIRDLVIGMKVVLASGTQIKAGGKVVKNVAGYDMCKLFVGSLGTLGIITETTLRMSPVPETAATLRAMGTPLHITELAHEIARSRLIPTAVFISNGPANASKTPVPFGKEQRENICKPSDRGNDDWHLALWSEGFEENVHRHLRDAELLAERIGLSYERLRDGNHQQYWNDLRDFPLRPDRLVYRLAVPLSAVTEVMHAIAGWKTADFDPEIVSDAAVGTIWIATALNQTSASQFTKLKTLAREHGGNAALLTAPAAYKLAIDVWGLPPPSLSLMRKVKGEFDPKGILNSGRFVAAM